MEKFIEELIEYLISRYKTTFFTADQVSDILLIKFNKKSLMYPPIASKWMKQLFYLIQKMGFGSYNPATQILELNENNEKVAIWKEKYIGEEN